MTFYWILCCVSSLFIGPDIGWACFMINSFMSSLKLYSLPLLRYPSGRLHGGNFHITLVLMLKYFALLTGQTFRWSRGGHLSHNVWPLKTIFLNGFSRNFLSKWKMRAQFPSTFNLKSLSPRSRAMSDVFKTRPMRALTRNEETKHLGSRVLNRMLLLAVERINSP